MNLLQEFVDFLKNKKDKPSSLTVKNYKADIGQFVAWFENQFKSTFNPSAVTLQTLEQYKKARNLSPASIQRHLSSLRKFFSFLNLNNIISYNPLEKKNTPTQVWSFEDPWMLRNFKSFLYECKKSNLTIKNYINDVKSFFIWLEETSLVKYSWIVNERNLLDKINYSVVEEYKQRLIVAKFSPLTINRKLSSLRSYITWALNQGLIPQNPENSEIQTITNSHKTITQSDEPILPTARYNSPFPPFRLLQKTITGVSFLFDSLFILPVVKSIENSQYLFWKTTGKKIFTKNLRSSVKTQENIAMVSNIQKEFYAPLTSSTRYLPVHKKVWHHIRHVRPNWYKKYHSYSFTHYLHFAILIILSCAVGFGAYDSLLAGMQKQNSILGAVTSAPPRILSFQGRLTDSSDNPITTSTNILFSMYDAEAAPIALWQETNLVTPDSGGRFSVMLGKSTPIPDTLFSQNQTLFLGIKIGDSAELSPRQQLATVPFASNSETLQGLEPITNTTKVSNVVLALDSSGNLSIAGSKGHTFQTIGGQFLLSGSVLSLTTVPGSNSRVEIVPDGMGKIDFSKPIQNSSNNNNISAAAGSVEFDDTVAILATTSAQAALYINQNSTGALISASTSGTAKFVVENDGTGKFSADLAVNGGDLTSTATTFNLLNSTVTTLNIGGAATSLVFGASTGTVTIRNATANIQGDITFGDAATDKLTFTGRVAQDSDLIPIGTSGTSDLGSSSLPWDNIYVDNIYTSSSGFSGHWQRTNGIVAPTNISDDLLLGATSTSSAKFGLTGIAGTTPTATIGGNLSLAVPTTAGANVLNYLNNSTLNIQRSAGGDAGLATVLFLANDGDVGVGTVTPGAKLDVIGGQTQIEVSTQYSQRLCHSGSDGSTTQSVLLGDCSTGGADIAEYYGSEDTTIEAGDIVVAAPGAMNVGLNSKAYVKKSDSTYQGSIIGIVSTNPYDSFGRNFDSNEHSFPVALAGRIPLKISFENGPIKAGDLLTSSSIPGVAMKATQTGIIVGKALENLDTIDNSKVIGYYDPESKEYRSKANFPDIPLKPGIIKIVKINTFANISWHDPDTYFANTGELVIKKNSDKYSITPSSNEALTNSKGFFDIAAAYIRGGLVKASEIITTSLIVTTDTIIVNGQNLKDYIAGLVDELGAKNQESEVILPVSRIDKLSANIISPLGESLIVRLATPSGEIDSSFTIQNSSGSAIATINSDGDASFSGQLSALSGQFEEASISGTLRSNNIIADSISGTNYIDIVSFSAQFAYVPNFQAEQGLFNQGLMVFGSTSLSDLSIAGNLSIGGTMFVTENSIETLGTDLSLQSLKQGKLSIMGGLVYIDTKGNITTQADLTVAGKLAVNVISPLPTSDLVVNNASGSSVLSISKSGDITASGSGTFAKLNFSLVQPVQALSSTEVIASSSAGIASIAPYHAELTVKNDLVTEKSVIYITPVGTPSAQAPFLMRQTPQESDSQQYGSFTVGVQSPTNRPIDFNWLIVN